MAKGPTQKTKRERLGVTASGIVEAIEQDVELSMEQVAAAAHQAVATVEKKLGVRKPAKPKAKTARAKPKIRKGR